MKWLILCLLVCGGLRSQESDQLIMELRTKLDSLVSFKADILLEEDISFVNMPDKVAILYFEKGKELRIESEDFIMIPKKGLDFTMRELFKYPYSSMNSGKDTISGIACNIIRIIPEDPEAEFSIATLALDAKALRIVKSEISTKKHGVFTIVYSYKQTADLLPIKIEVQFSISEVKIPLRYLGKDTEMDKAIQRENEEETGAFFIHFSNYQISRL